MAIQIDLKGPDGNAYALMAMSANFAKQIGMEKDKLNKILSDMRSGDYNNLVKVFDENFGMLVTIDNMPEGITSIYA
jgi:hypothetical protein